MPGPSNIFAGSPILKSKFNQFIIGVNMGNPKSTMPPVEETEKQVAVDEMERAALILTQYFTGFETYPSRNNSSQTMYNLIYTNEETGNEKFPTVKDFAKGMLKHGTDVKKSMSFIVNSRDGKKLFLNAISQNSREVNGEEINFIVCVSNEQKPISALGQLTAGVNNYGENQRRTAEARAEKALVAAGGVSAEASKALSITEWNFESGF